LGKKGTWFISQEEDRYDAKLPFLFLGHYAETGHGLKEHYVSFTKHSETSPDDLSQMYPELCNEFDKKLYSIDSKPQQNNDAIAAGKA